MSFQPCLVPSGVSMVPTSCYKVNYRPDRDLNGRAGSGNEGVVAHGGEKTVWEAGPKSVYWTYSSSS